MSPKIIIKIQSQSNRRAPYKANPNNSRAKSIIRASLLTIFFCKISHFSKQIELSEGNFRDLFLVIPNLYENIALKMRIFLTMVSMNIFLWSFTAIGFFKFVIQSIIESVKGCWPTKPVVLPLSINIRCAMISIENICRLQHKQIQGEKCNTWNSTQLLRSKSILFNANFAADKFD